MANFDQVPFDASDFAENPEPRCPCLLLLDTSYSMSGSPISELNAGLTAFKDELMADSMAAKRVEISVMTFGPVTTLNNFETPDIWQPPELKVTGDTPIGAAITAGIEKLRQRKDTYRQNGISYYRPWIFLITDGAPTDSWHEAARAVAEGEESKSLMFFAVGVEGADFGTLKQLSVREPLKLKELRFRDLFVWLSNSLSSVSRSRPEDAIPLSNPTTPDGWATTE